MAQPEQVMPPLERRQLSRPASLAEPGALFSGQGWGQLALARQGLDTLKGFREVSSANARNIARVRAIASGCCLFCGLSEIGAANP
eukprot:6184620-Pleurochrysis_carterae.AAC.5